MKTTNIIGASLLGMVATCAFTGCAPVGELTEVSSSRGVCGNHIVSVDTCRRGAAGYNLLRQYRPYSIEPVGERIEGPNFLSYGNITYGPTRQPISPYGPPSPCIRSLWW